LLHGQKVALSHLAYNSYARCMISNLVSLYDEIRISNPWAVPAPEGRAEDFKVWNLI